MSFMFSLTLALVTGVIAAEKGLTSLWPLEECTGKSLYIPSWVISQFSSSRAGVSFTLINRVTEVSSSISCSVDGECLGASNNDLKVAVQIEETVVEITVEDAWTCRDKKTRDGELKTIHFKATGDASLSLDCHSEDDAQVCVSAQDVDLVRGSLTEPIHVGMQGSAARAQSSNSSTCPALTAPPSWNLTGIYYQNNTKGNPWVGPEIGRLFAMDTVNLVSGDVAKCANGYLGGPYDDPRVYGANCWRDPWASWQEPAGTGQLWTSYDFNEITHDIAVKQRWYCDELKTMKAFVVNGTGTEHLDLHCSGGIPDTDPNIRCDSPTITVTGEVVSREELPPFSIQDPYPDRIDSGMVQSIVDPFLQIARAELNVTRFDRRGSQLHRIRKPSNCAIGRPNEL
ncbi:hypothetical protein F4778DRAFT_788561 [Xylariomycetidae sp. FL2044]|nr:hypothetical protein F4778DRAFT_788561 [Xylariomycetidae sp. FL2044]